MKKLQVKALRLIVVGVFSLFAVVTLSAQAPQCPAGYVCITQEAANVAAANARENVALNEKISAQDDALKLKDQTITENKATAAKNEADLLDRLHKTEVELARNVGMITQCQANLNNNQLVITALVQNTKARNRIGLINF